MRRLDSVLARADDNGWGHMGSWGGGWMWLWAIAMMALSAVLIVWLVRVATSKPGSSPVGTGSGDRAREILAERYARGELTTEEYQERREQLQ